MGWYYYIDSKKKKNLKKPTVILTVAPNVSPSNKTVFT